jgi:hypothetical protein
MDVTNREAHTLRGPARLGKWLLLAELILLLISAIFAVMFTRGDSSMDAISYFEISDAIHHHQWSTMVNGYWTPGYAILLSAGRHLAHAGAAREWPVARFTNLFLLALFVAAVLYLIKTLCPEGSKGGLLTDAIDDGARLSRLGLSVVAVATIIELSGNAYDATRINPDILVGALFVLVVAVLNKLQMRPKIWHYFALGLLCGIGYLAKAIFFPLTLVVIAAVCFIGPKRGKAIAGALVATLVFSALAGPFIAALSRSKGHFSYGDSGHLNYIWLVNGFPRPPLLPVTDGKVDTVQLGLKHPVTVLETNPFIASFGGQIDGMYPLWTDASYWLDGVKVPFSLKAAVARFLVNIKNLFEILGDLILSTAIVLALVFAGWRETRWRSALLQHWPGLLVSIAMIGAYMAVEVDTRYIATVLLVLYLVVLSSLHFPDTAGLRTGIPTLLLALFAALALRQTASTLPVIVDAAKKHAITSAFTARPYWMRPEIEQAEAFHALGISAPNTTVACIGSNDCDNYWLRLAGLHVISEAYYGLGEIHRYWELSPERQQQVLRRLAGTGATIAISTSEVNAPLPAGWTRLAGSNVIVMPLNGKE